MARTPKVWWHKGANAWCSGVGHRLSNGRRAPVYFKHPHTERGRRAAQAELAALVANREREEGSAPKAVSELTVSHVVQAYMQDCEGRLAAGELKRSTLAAYRQALAIWNARYGEKWAKSIGSDDLARVVREWQKEKKYGA